MDFDWNCVGRYYRLEKQHLSSSEVNPLEHPLRSKSSLGSRLEVGKKVGLSTGAGHRHSLTSPQGLVADPLLLTLSLDGTDPLSQFVRQDEQEGDGEGPSSLQDSLSQLSNEYKRSTAINNSGRLVSSDSYNQDEIDISWKTKRLSILNKYTTSEKLSISTSFLSTGKAFGTSSDTIKVQTMVSDKVKYRLEQLDDFEEDDVRQMLDLTQQEYIQRIQELNQELVHSWHNDQRVKALKIAIQCSKILVDTSVLPFYPSQFVLITDILDIFGHLVYERLMEKATQGNGTSMSKISEENARSTCLNWFFKVASIRELLPRLYIEMSIIKCYGFLKKASYEKAFERLTQMIRGIGNPLVAIYCRCYLIRKATTAMSHFNVLQPVTKDLIFQNITDIFSVYHTMFSNAIQSELKLQQITMNRYLTLYEPALQFILQALFHMNQLHHQSVLEQIKLIKNSGIVLMALLVVCPPEVIAVHAIDILDIILSLPPGYNVGASQPNLLRTFGLKISGHCSSATSNSLPLNEQRSHFLKNVFEIISNIHDGNEYLLCVESWSEFIIKNFPISEVNSYLGEINKRLSTHKLCSRHCQLLYNIFDKILHHQKNIEILLAQDNFLPFMDLLQVDDIKQQACKHILTAYRQNCEEIGNITLDPVIINALMHISKILGNSVNALTVDEERRHISQLICYFVRKVNFGRDVERQLSFYTEVRGSFTDLDEVYCTVVHSVNKLAMIITSKIMANDHKHEKQQQKDLSSERKAFVKTCIAFCYITIPSVNSVQQRLDLYLLSGQVALSHQCLGQADGCFEAALQIMEDEVPLVMKTGQLNELYVVGFLSNLLAILVLVPDSPEQGVLHLLRRIIALIPKLPFRFSSANGIGSLNIYLRALDLLHIQSLEEFPVHINGVVSNDVLYGQDPKFLGEINNLCNQLVECILEHLRQLGLNQQYRWQAHGALELFERAIRYTDLGREKTFQSCVNLWNLARKHKSLLNENYFSFLLNTLKTIESKVIEEDPWSKKQGEHLTRLLTHLQV